MALDFNCAKFLKFVIKKKKLGKVATIGRLQLAFSNKYLKNLVDSNFNFNQGDYCEKFLKNIFNAEVVESFDNSKLEGATYVEDMNEPLKINLPRYDTVIDFGSSEHIFNVAQNLTNISLLCKKGGQILHCLPANNHCGHGFWQFSPELFFSLYSKDNGFDNTEVFVSNVHDTVNLWKVFPQEPGKRIELNSMVPIYLLVKTEKIYEKTKQKVQQLATNYSDYKNMWVNNNVQIDFDEHALKKSKSSIFVKNVKNHLKFFLRHNIITQKIYNNIEATKLTKKKDYKKNKNLKKITGI